MSIIKPIAQLLGYILDILFMGLNAIGIGNIAIAIIIFTLLVKMLMLPLQIKQQKMTKLQSVMNPEIKAIQEKYKGKNSDTVAMQKMQAETKAVYEKYHDEYDPYLEDRERIKWKLAERPNSYYYFVKKDEENIGFLRVQTNEELTEAWLGTAAILPPYQGKGYGSEGLRLLEEELSTITQWDLCTVLQDARMVAFYEKNGYRQTHIEPEKEGMYMVYMKKLIDK